MIRVSYNKVATFWFVVYLLAYVLGCRYNGETFSLDGVVAVIICTIFSLIGHYYACAPLESLLEGSDG